MADSKRLKSYNNTNDNVYVPTSVGGKLVREIADNTFKDKNINYANIDTYANDITGAPWGAKNVVWLKEPVKTITYKGNGGTIPNEPIPAPTSTILTWNGDATGKTVVNVLSPLPSFIITYTKISDTVYNKSDILGGTGEITIAEDVIPIELITESLEGCYRETDDLIGISDDAFIIIKRACINVPVLMEGFTATFEEPGVYSMSGNFYSNVAYGSKLKILNSDSINIEWNGDIEGKETITIYNENLYKIKQYTPLNLASVELSRIFMIFNDTEQEFYGGWLKLCDDCYMGPSAPMVIIAFKDVTYDNIDISQGIWFLKYNSNYISKFLFITWPDTKMSNINWDGDISGITDKYIVYDEEEEWCSLYKISSTPLSVSDFNLSCISFGTDSDIMKVLLYPFKDGDVILGRASESRNYVIFVLSVIKDTVYNNLTLKRGLYLWKMDESYYVTKFSYLPAIGGDVDKKSYLVNKGVGTKLLTNMFTNVPTGKQFDGWLIGSTEGIKAQPDSTYIFNDNSDLYASWKNAT